MDKLDISFNVIINKKIKILNHFTKNKQFNFSSYYQLKIDAIQQIKFNKFN